MVENLAVDRANGIITVCSVGRVDKSELLHLIAAVQVMALRHNVHRLLVDTRMQESLPSTHTLFDIFSHFPDDLQVAVVADRRQDTAEAIHFIETVARNRARDVRVFEFETEALNWLKYARARSLPAAG